MCLYLLTDYERNTWVFSKVVSTRAKLISLYLFLLKTCGKLLNNSLITSSVIHIVCTHCLCLWITCELSTMLLTGYQQVINRYRRVINRLVSINDETLLVLACIFSACLLWGCTKTIQRKTSGQDFFIAACSGRQASQQRLNCCTGENCSTGVY